MSDMHHTPSVLAVHDLSCLGRCALTVAMPTLSAMGVQAVPLPTAVLSAHTGFAGPQVEPLDGFMRRCVDHWKALGVRFDAMYSGYLASAEQAALVGDIIAWQRENGALTIVDPAMADHGRLYTGLPAGMPAAMKALCDGADVITPNLTEACMMLGVPYAGPQIGMTALRPLLEGYSAAHMIITGAVYEGAHANIYRRAGDQGFWLCPYEQVASSWHGTGDLFASVLTGALVRGGDVPAAIALAGGFVSHVIRESAQANAPEAYGVLLEPALPLLWRRDVPVMTPGFIKYT